MNYKIHASPGPGAPLDCCPDVPRLWVGSWSVHTQEPAHECLNNWNNKLLFLSLALALALPLSFKSRNE